MIKPKLRFDNFTTNWRKVKLKEVVDINPSKKKPKTFQYIDLGSVKSGGIQNKLQTYTPDTAPSRAQRVLKPKDILYQTVRPYQRNNLYFDLMGDYIASTGYAQLRSKSEDPLFIYYLLHTDRFVNTVMARSTGTSYPAINTKDLSTINIDIPLIEEQNLISDFFSKLDFRIENQEKLIDLLEKKKTGYMQKIFNKELKFKDKNNNEFPDWEINTLSEIGFFYNGLTGKNKNDFEQGNKKFITYMSVFKDIIVDPANLEYVKLNENEKQNKVEYGDILFTQSSETMHEIGMNSVWLSQEEVYLNSFCFGFRLDTDKYNPEFINYSLRSDNSRKNVIREGQGSTRFNLSSSRLEKAEIEIPCLEEQKLISGFLKTIDTEIMLERNILTLLIELKESYMQQMFI